MPSEPLSPGFFGKIPATGDFVTRRLPGEFVRFWDRLAARHLVRLIETGLWPPGIGLRFLTHVERCRPMAGVSVPSSDRVGRRFPLTVAATVRNTRPAMATEAADWFETIQEVAISARDSGDDADMLTAALSPLPFPPQAGAETRPSHCLLLWTGRMAPIRVDPEGPQGALEELLAPVREAG